MTHNAWFGETREGWTSAPLGYYFDVVLGKMLNASKDLGATGSAPYLAAGSIQPEYLVLDETKMMPFSEDELAQYELRKCDIVVVEGGAGYGRSHLLREGLPGWGFQNHVARLRSRGSVRPGFLTYCLKACLASGYIEANNRTATLPSLSRDVLRSIPVPIPPLDVQRAIADYLDRETAQIDELIAQQHRLIELLLERRASVAEGILGCRVGEGERLKQFLAESDVRAGDRAVDLPLLSVSISWGVRRRDEVTDENARAEDLSNYKRCLQGDLIINRMRAFQGALGLAPEDGVVSPDYAVLTVRSGLDAGWLVAAMRSLSFVAQMAQRVKGIGSAELGNARTPRLNIADLGEIRLRIPSLDQQLAELADVREQSAQVDQLVAEAQRFVELAQERRAALITAAVTGQIDVRGAA